MRNRWTKWKIYVCVVLLCLYRIKQVPPYGGVRSPSSLESVEHLQALLWLWHRARTNNEKDIDHHQSAVEMRSSNFSPRTHALTRLKLQLQAPPFKRWGGIFCSFFRSYMDTMLPKSKGMFSTHITLPIILRALFIAWGCTLQWRLRKFSSTIRSWMGFLKRVKLRIAFEPRRATLVLYNS